MNLLSPYNQSNPFWVGAAGNPYDIDHPCYPYKGIFNETTCGHLFPSDQNDLYHYDNINNPYHPDNPNHIILKGGTVRNPDNPYNTASSTNPYHPDNPYRVDKTPCDEATKPQWINNIYKPCHPDNPYKPPVIEKPIEPCNIRFSLVARSAAYSRIDEEYKQFQTEPDTTLQVLPNRMRALRIEDIFKFRQQFLEEIPNIHKFDSTETQTYCAEPSIPDSEQLTLVVDNTSGVFHVPVGGLSSSGSECFYDWDIWVDHQYKGRYIGYSGLRNEGIELPLISESYKSAPTVTTFPHYTRFSNADDVHLDIHVQADGGWNCIPFWIRLDNGGILIDRAIGIFNELLYTYGLRFNSPNVGNTVIAVRNREDVRISDWLIQGFVFYPNRPLNDCAIEICLLDIRHDMYFYHDITLGSRPDNIHDGKQHCIEPAFMLSSGRIQINNLSSLNFHAKCALENFVNEIADVINEPQEPQPEIDTTLTFGVRLQPTTGQPSATSPIEIGHRDIENSGEGGGAGSSDSLVFNVIGWNRINGRYVSDNHTDNSDGTLCTVTYTTTAQTIYINVGVSSETNFDWLVVKDSSGSVIGRISGDQEVSYEISASASGTILLQYTKDVNRSVGNDEGYFYGLSLQPMFTMSGGGSGNIYVPPSYENLETLPKNTTENEPFTLIHSPDFYEPLCAYDGLGYNDYGDSCASCGYYGGYWGIDFSQNTIGMKTPITLRRIEVEGSSYGEFQLFYTDKDNVEHELPIVLDRYGDIDYIYVWEGTVQAKSLRLSSPSYASIYEVTLYKPAGVAGSSDFGCVKFSAAVSNIVQLGRQSSLKPVTKPPLVCKPPLFQLSTSGHKRVRDSLLSESDQKKVRCHWYPVEEGKSVITIRPYYATKGWQGWLRAFGFHPSSPELWNTPENKNKLLEISVGITPAMIADSQSDAGNYCMRYWLYGCRNVRPGREFRFVDWKNTERAGNDFLFKAFYGCESFDYLPLDYDEPKFKTVGNNYKAYKFYECCNLEDVGLILTTPPVESAGDAYEAFEYYGCKKLLRLPIGYTEPQTLTGTNMADHQIYKFALCQSLHSLPYHYRESPLVHVHDNYHAYKFSGSGLRSLPVFYAEALSLTFIGRNCCTGKFKDCVLLASLPVDYTEINPANMGINFIKNKFSGCVSLLINGNYKFPLLTATMIEYSGVFAGVFAITGGLLQNVTANGIINGNSPPPDDRGTFSGIFGDYGMLHTNWKS